MNEMIMTEQEKNATISKMRWKLVPYLMVLYFLSMMDRNCMSFGALQMNAELGITPAAFGLLAGIFFIPYFFCEVPSNIIMHRVGARVWIARILISWGLVTMLTGFADSLFHLQVLRFLLGICEAGFYPCIILYLTYFFPAKYLGKTIGVFMCAMAVSNIFTGIVSTWIMDNVHLFGMSGWRWMFIIEGLPAFILGFVSLRVMIDRPSQAKFLTEREKLWIESELKAEQQTKATSSSKAVSTFDGFKNPKVWYLCIPYISYIIALYGLGMWMPQLIKQMSASLSNTQVGLIAAVPYLFGILIMYLVAKHSDKVQERRYHVGLPIALAFFGLIALTKVDSVWAGILLISISTAGIYSFIGTFWTIPNAFLGEAAAAVGIAVINSVGNLGGFIGPYLVGIAKSATGSTDSGMYILACFALLATLTTILIPKKSLVVGSDKQSDI